MRIGLTYDLKADYLARGFSAEEAAEFDRPETIEGIEQALESLGHHTERIGALPALMQALLDGRRWDIVFNIAEGLHGFGREAQVPAVLDYFGLPYVFSETMVLALCLHKGMCKSVVRDAGLATPDFAAVEEPDQAFSVALPFPLFVKPVAEGTGIGIGAASRVDDQPALSAACAHIIQRYRQPALVEAFLPGRELTVGIVGNGSSAASLGAMEVIFTDKAEADAYGYVNKQEYQGRMRYMLATDNQARDAEELAVRCWRALGCRDGGRVDIRLDATGTPHFLEVNPLAGLNPVDSDLPILCGLAGIGYTELIARIMKAAVARIQNAHA